MGKLFSSFLGHVLPGVARPLRILWNEIIGFLFLALAGLSIPSVVRSIRQMDSEDGSLFRTVLAVSFVGLMAYFGITSFLRARKISRS